MLDSSQKNAWRDLREIVDLAQSPGPRLRYPSAELETPEGGRNFRAAIGGGPSMPKIIDILLDEHQNIEKLLLVRSSIAAGGQTTKSCNRSSSISRTIPKAAITPKRR